MTDIDTTDKMEYYKYPLRKGAISWPQRKNKKYGKKTESQRNLQNNFRTVSAKKVEE